MLFRLFFRRDTQMTISQAITMADELKPNMMSDVAKIRFLNEVEGKVFLEILMKHEHEEGAECPAYDENTDQTTELLVQPPYDMLYVYWIIAQIDHLNMEMEKYNNDRLLFEDAWNNFSDYWTREHMPTTASAHFRL